MRSDRISASMNGELGGSVVRSVIGSSGTGGMGSAAMGAVAAFIGAASGATGRGVVARVRCTGRRALELCG
jgi:hypothetical protein